MKYGQCGWENYPVAKLAAFQPYEGWAAGGIQDLTIYSGIHRPCEHMEANGATCRKCSPNMHFVRVLHHRTLRTWVSGFVSNKLGISEHLKCAFICEDGLFPVMTTVFAGPFHALCNVLRGKKRDTLWPTDDVPEAGERTTYCPA